MNLFQVCHIVSFKKLSLKIKMLQICIMFCIESFLNQGHKQEKMMGEFSVQLGRILPHFRLDFRL